MKNWKFFNHEFSFFNKVRDFTWIGHTFFAYDLIRNKKPQVIVELGTYKGTSLFSFAEGVKDENLDTQIFCVDSWTGDEQTGFYNDSVYNNLVSDIRELFPGLNIRLLRKTFEEAINDFDDKTIDILHIDGLHTYEAVLNDYSTWKEKVKEDGIIMFHDTKVADFGVWKVWNKVKKENPKFTFLNFKQNYGLGVMFKKDKFTDEEKDIMVNMYYKESLSANLLFENNTLEREYLNIMSRFNDISVNYNNIQEANNSLNKEISSLNHKINSKDYEIKLLTDSLRKYQKVANTFPLNIAKKFYRKLLK